MKFGDILALAKAGYTRKDIEDLMKLDPETTPDPSGDPAPEEQPEPAAEPAGSVDPGKPEKDAGAPPEESDEIKKLKEKLKAAQDAAARSARQPEKPEKSDADILKDMARRFM